MALQLLLQNKSQVTLISAYASAMTNPNEMKDGYYEELDTLLSAVSRINKLILLDNFNTRIGCDSAAWQGVIGRYRVVNCNTSVLLLVESIAAHDFLNSNITFCLTTCN